MKRVPGESEDAYQQRNARAYFARKEDEARARQISAKEDAEGGDDAGVWEKVRARVDALEATGVTTYNAVKKELAAEFGTPPGGGGDPELDRELKKRVSAYMESKSLAQLDAEVRRL